MVHESILYAYAMAWNCVSAILKKKGFLHRINKQECLLRGDTCHAGQE